MEKEWKSSTRHKEYKVNNYFNESGISLNELINTFLLSFFDVEFAFTKNDGIINNDITSNL